MQKSPLAPRARAGRRRIALVSVHGDPLLPFGAEEAGGQNVYVREVARALAERGHEVDVFTRGRDVEAPEETALGRARVIRLPAGPGGFISRNELFPFLPAFVAAMRRFARRERREYELLHTNYWLSGWVGMQIAPHWGVPQLHTHHSLGAIKYAALGHMPEQARLRLEVEDQLSSRCASIIATSPQDVVSLARHYQTPAPTAIVPCGVNAGAFYPRDRAACRARLGLDAQAHVLAYCGRFDPQKGIETFVRAAARLAGAFPIQLVLSGGFDPRAGDAAEFRRIQALVRELGLAERTHFLGQVEQAALGEVYAAADVCVVPSHYESFGLVAIEAMACGTPVVASDVGGLRYSVVHRETGLLVPPRSPEAFAGALAMLLEDPGLRTRMGQAGARLVSKLFTWEAVASQLEALYDGVALSSPVSMAGCSA